MPKAPLLTTKERRLAELNAKRSLHTDWRAASVKAQGQLTTLVKKGTALVAGRVPTDPPGTEEVDPRLEKWAAQMRDLLQLGEPEGLNDEEAEERESLAHEVYLFPKHSEPDKLMCMHTRDVKPWTNVDKFAVVFEAEVEVASTFDYNGDQLTQDTRLSGVEDYSFEADVDEHEDPDADVETFATMEALLEAVQRCMCIDSDPDNEEHERHDKEDGCSIIGVKWHLTFLRRRAYAP
jgi:hypothetical protein